MIEIIGIIGLIILFYICVPTYEKWSYKENYKRSMAELKRRKEEESNES